MKNAETEILEQIRSDWNSYLIYMGNKTPDSTEPRDVNEYRDMFDRMNANMESIESLLKIS